MTRWRMQRVRRALIKTTLSFTTIAGQNGYRSRTSRSQAFRRMFGLPPQDRGRNVRPQLENWYEDEAFDTVA